MKSQIQFNWIFVLVAGSIILLFFVGFAIKYQDLQEKKQEIVFLNNFDRVLTNLQSSSFKTSTSIDIPLDLNVDCNGFYINERHESINLFFSSNKLENRVYVWYYPFEHPFQTADFYFLVDDEITIDTNNPEIIEDLIYEMPETFKSKVKLGQGKEIDIQGDLNGGIVTIDGEQYEYYGQGLLYGAVFSDDYGCLLNKVNLRFDGVIESYLNKINVLKKSGCNYNQIYSKLNALKMDKSYELIQDIENLNQDLASADCPVVF